MACADEVEEIFAARPGKIAALVVEPLVQGADGMIAQPPGYLRRMREICDRHGALLVCDEVATGFGRTGTMFAVEQEGVVPDILTVAKGITGGYLPLAATLTTERGLRVLPRPVRRRSGPSSTATPTPGIRSPAPRRPRRCGSSATGG